MNFNITQFQDVAVSTEKQAVRARELYKGLELDQNNYARWEKQVISEFAENEDYITLLLDEEGQKNLNLPKNVVFDLILSLNTAKHLALKTNTSKGKEVRQYFIDAEKKALIIPTAQLFKMAQERKTEVKQELRKHEEEALKLKELLSLFSKGQTPSLSTKLNMSDYFVSSENFMSNAEVSAHLEGLGIKESIAEIGKALSAQGFRKGTKKLQGTRKNQRGWFVTKKA